MEKDETNFEETKCNSKLSGNINSETDKERERRLKEQRENKENRLKMRKMIKEVFESVVKLNINIHKSYTDLNKEELIVLEEVKNLKSCDFYKEDGLKYNFKDYFADFGFNNKKFNLKNIDSNYKDNRSKIKKEIELPRILSKNWETTSLEDIKKNYLNFDDKKKNKLLSVRTSII